MKILFLSVSFLLAQCWISSAVCLEYRLTDIGKLGGNDSRAHALNNRGDVVGRSTIGNTTHPFLFTNGQIFALGVLPGHSYGWAESINDQMQIVGWSANDEAGSDAKPFIWQNGQMQIIPLPNNAVGKALAINNFGQVVGMYRLPGRGYHGFLYSGNSFLDLGSFGGTFDHTVAYGINDLGHIVGSSHLKTSQRDDTCGFFWRNGVMDDLGDLPGGKYQAYAYAINNHDQVVGESASSESLIRAFLWNKGHMQDLGVLDHGHDLSIARAINDNGEVVGLSGKVGLTPAAFVWNSQNGMQNLNSLVDSTADRWTLGWAWDINSSGQIAGFGYNPDGEMRAFLLTPVPEPSQIVIVLATLSSVIAYAQVMNIIRRCFCLLSNGRLHQ